MKMGLVINLRLMHSCIGNMGGKGLLPTDIYVQNVIFFEKLKFHLLQIINVL